MSSFPENVLVAMLVSSAVLPSPTSAAVPDCGSLVNSATASSAYLRVHRLYRASPVETQGSGFFLAFPDVVVTNWHVVAPDIEVDMFGHPTRVDAKVRKIEVVVLSGTAEERTLSAKVVAMDKRHDLALLKVRGAAPCWLTLGETAPAQLDEVVAVSFPFGDQFIQGHRSPEPTLSPGRVTAVRHADDGSVDSLQIDASVNPGSSGGALLDSEGRVIGVISSGIVGANAVSFAIPLQTVAGFIDSRRARVQLEPDSVFQREAPLTLTVTPLLFSGAGLRCRARLSGEDIQEQLVELEWVNGRFEGELRLPQRQPERLRTASYWIDVSIVDGSHSTVLTKRVALPVREHEIPKAGNEEDPHRVLRDRVIAADAVEGGFTDSLLPPSAPGKDSGRKALSQLATELELRGGAGDGATITNAKLDPCWRAQSPEKYERLAEKEQRDLAQGWDYAECTYTNLLAEVQTLTYSRPESHEDEYVIRESLARCFVRLTRVRKKLTAMEIQLGADSLCRCASGVWGFRSARPCDQCEQPIMVENDLYERIGRYLERYYW